jgi:hypothetical protein
MMKKPRQVDPNPINPDHLYRWADGPRYFGYASTVLNEKIDDGHVPMPVYLSDDGRARGWFGRTILAWQREQEAKAAERHQRMKQECARKRAEREKRVKPKAKVAA